jgi:hypothetical protein
MLYGFLNFEAVALTVFGLAPFVGKYLIPVALALFVFVNAPTSGGAIPYQMVPTFFDWLHPVMPLGNLIDAMRSIFYFDGTNMIRPTLVLCAWIALGIALITISDLLHRARQRPAPAVGPAGPPIRELPRPGSRRRTRHAASAHRPRRDGRKRHQRLRPPAAHAVRQGHRRHRRPLWAANITIIDAYGHQLMRTSTDQSGRYAVDSLPGGILTVLLSPPGQMPLATRVLLTSDLPVRQDFVLPDAPQGAGRDAALLYRM